MGWVLLLTGGLAGLFHSIGKNPPSEKELNDWYNKSLLNKQRYKKMSPKEKRDYQFALLGIHTKRAKIILGVICWSVIIIVLGLLIAF
ncbi:hypothetical protein [Helicobacter sp. 11S02629-2]|uniref:hypothetical protein n=1 Tax=Helicobacter sp. 11S02629-2 TaxID=1476195 RepID=UPI000BA593E8|nr:hypothetical protein [Helicobacter sp. 11S02629-2]PAF42903.1 hypothetical protein BKH40_07515 [Helicobacter sp. 11S02629-2]